MKVFHYNNMVINVEDDDPQCEWLKDIAKEIPANIFGDFAHYACSNNTKQIDGQWVFSFDPLVQQAKDFEQYTTVLRAERDRLVAASDWTQLPDAPLGEAAKTAWTDYRQALRDLPQQPGFPWDGDISNAPWPTEPNTTREHTPAKSTAKPNKKAKAE